MATFLLVCHDAGGTVPPIVALVESLVARGHRVIVLSQPSVRGRAQAAGAAFLAFSEIPDYESRKALEEQIDVVFPAMTGRTVADDLVAVANEHRFDMVVVDANLAGALAGAESLGLPTVVLLHSMYRTYVDTWFGELWPLLAPAVNETRALFGLADARDWASVFAGHERILSVVPTAFDAPVAAVPETMSHFGFLVPAPSSRATVDYPAGDEPTILVGLSTTYQEQEAVLGPILEALAGLPVRALVTTAGQIDIAAGSRPANVTITDYVSHALLLDHTDAMITHAGLGSVAGALTFGVPLVCIPHSRDQPLNAGRVAALGAGIDAGAHPTASEIAAAVETVLTAESYREAARAIAATSRAEGGAAAAARELEALAG